MAKIKHETALFNARELIAFGSRVLMAKHVPEPDAEYVAWHLVETNLRGTDSHGIARLPHYVRRLQGGSIAANPSVTFQSLGPSAGRISGNHGLGHLVMRRAAVEAAALAKSTGAGWVTVQNSSHCGSLAPFGLQLAELGMIGFVFTHVDPMVLPFGGREPFCGTNPLCIAAPAADGRTVCLDLATSIVPWNLVSNAAREGVLIPRDWAVDHAGQATDDPHQVVALHPFGQHKGSGLGFMIDILCALLAGAPFGPDIPKMYGDMTEPRRLGGLVGAISIKHFIDENVFASRVSEMAARLGAVLPAQGFDRVRFPGEPELETKRQRELTGIPVGIQTLAELNELAASLGLPILRRPEDSIPHP